ncbi:glucuronate isomerase [Microbacterium sp. AGC62]
MLTARNYARLLPSDPSTRATALHLYGLVATHPILSPHGHVDPSLFVEDAPFTDPVALFIRDDHYVTRLLHADGMTLDSIGLQRPWQDVDTRAVWRSFCKRWHLFAGTASGYWLGSTLADVFGITRPLTENNADELYDEIDSALRRPEMRPRALLESFRIELLATTDDPLDSLDPHVQLSNDSSLSTQVRPSFRPDSYIDPAHPAWRENVSRLLSTSANGGYDGYLEALRQQRRRFVNAGATSADFGVVSADTLEMSRADATAVFDRARNGSASDADRAQFLAHMLFESARMSVEDGLVMTIHAGVLRNHHTPTFQKYGADRGHDIPVPTSFVKGLRPLLNEFGSEPGFQLILFTVDETTYSREIAPLAGFYPSVFIGAPWWFLDAPESAQRFRAATVETAGFYRGSGFVDDTRAFMSIPARHDMARRVDAGFLARMVADERLSLEQAEMIMGDLVDAIPRRAFKL